MRFNNGVKTALVAATAGLLLSACSSDSGTDASEAAESTVDTAAIAANIDTLTGCDTFGGTWAGGESTDEDAAAVAEYTCDVDGDGAIETTLWIYGSADDAAADLANVEAASADTAILEGDGYLVATTDSSHLASIANEDLAIVRELPVAE